MGSGKTVCKPLGPLKAQVIENKPSESRSTTRGNSKKAQKQEQSAIYQQLAQTQAKVSLAKKEGK
jgi:hypothetical protein